MTLPRNRKLAWVVLGVVVVGTVVLLVQISCLYSPWEPSHVSTISMFSRMEYDRYWVVRYQRYSWLPGPDTQRSEVTKVEYAELLAEPSVVLSEPAIK